MMEQKKEQKKKKKLPDGLKLLNPKNLEKEVHVYGYHFSWKAHVLALICSLLGVGAIGVAFQLGPVYFAVIVSAVLVALPVFILDVYKRMFEQKRFSNVTDYMEQMLYSFQQSGKVVSALKETRELFEAGQMQESIDEAIEYVETGLAKTKKGVLREALEIIERPFECVKIQMVHELLVNSEEYGGDVENSILLLLEDIEIWKRRGYRLQAEKKKSHVDNIISIVVSTILCMVALYVLDSMQTLFPGATVGENIFQIPLIQFSSMLFILIMLLVLVQSFNSLAVNWLSDDKMYQDEYILDSYNSVMNYDDLKEKKKSVLFSAPFLIAAIPVFLFYKKWLGIILILVAVFMLMQHRVGCRLAKRDVETELYMTLPQWLMQLALLMQNNNVQVSLAKSVEGAPVVLREELKKLMERLKEKPGKLESYLNFCRDFDVPEAQSCMKMLHAIAESGTGSAKVQIDNLLHRVSEMQDMADQIRSESIAFKMKMIFSYPVLAATVKLLVDLTFGMMFMFSMLGNMGGM